MKLLIVSIVSFLAYVQGIADTTELGTRIPGGATADIQEYPFAAALLTNAGGSSFRYGCGGTILTASTILSAASCFYTDATLDPFSWWRARVGSTESNTGGLIYLVIRITSHPDFQPGTLEHNLAVLKTTFAMVLTPSVAAAYIAGGAYQHTERQSLWAIGWGSNSTGSPNSEYLRQVELFVVNHSTCVNRYHEVGVTVTPNMLCVGWLDVGVRGQCQGDEGSSLVHNGVVVGVFSWTQHCGGIGYYPNINTPIFMYTRWIVDTATAP